MRPDRYVVVVGCGRLGAQVANQLSRDGNSVVVIDRAEATFRNLSPDFSGFRVEGDATQLAVLREAKLRNADVLIATTHDDNVNLMVAQVARRLFDVPDVIARVFDPKREEVYAQLGIATVCPTSVGAALLLRAVENGAADRAGQRP
ncbi:MAG TPA: TrkA family potassium uptake protein [Phycisphaerae bacterium]|nr:TrkA family potassium uptake protein [Phycisphaerae bacterium]